MLDGLAQQLVQPLRVSVALVSSSANVLSKDLEEGLGDIPLDELCDRALLLGAGAAVGGRMAWAAADLTKVFEMPSLAPQDYQLLAAVLRLEAIEPRLRSTWKRRELRIARVADWMTNMLVGIYRSLPLSQMFEEIRAECEAAGRPWTRNDGTAVDASDVRKMIEGFEPVITRVVDRLGSLQPKASSPVEQVPSPLLREILKRFAATILRFGR